MRVDLDRNKIVFWEDLKNLPRDRWPVTMEMPPVQFQGPFGEEVRGARDFYVVVEGYRLDLGHAPASPEEIGTWDRHYKTAYVIRELILKLNGQAAYIEDLERRLSRLETIVAFDSKSSEEGVLRFSK